MVWLIICATDASRSNGFTLITGFKSPEDVLFKADLAKWRETSEVILTVDKAEEGYEGHVGLVTKFIPDLPIKNLDDVQGHCRWTSNDDAFYCPRVLKTWNC